MTAKWMMLVTLNSTETVSGAGLQGIRESLLWRTQSISVELRGSGAGTQVLLAGEEHNVNAQVLTRLCSQCLKTNTTTCKHLVPGSDVRIAGAKFNVTQYWLGQVPDVRTTSATTGLGSDGAAEAHRWILDQLVKVALHPDLYA